MTDKKLTDNEIVKVLVEWIKDLKDDYKRLQLLDAPMDCFEESHVDKIRVLSNFLNLINRQKADLAKKDKELLEELKYSAVYKTKVIDSEKEINRLNAENERLTNLCREQNTEIDRLIKTKNNLLYNLKAVCEEKDEENIKAEAYKECIEKVEEIICDNTYPDFDINHKAVNIWKAEAYKNINNLLKELVGDTK